MRVREAAGSPWIRSAATGVAAPSRPPAAAEPQDSALLGTADEAKVPLSLADRISLGAEKKELAQAFFSVGRELAKRVTGDPDRFEYHKSPGLTNLDDSASLWALQAKHGDKGTTARSVPVTMLAMAAGALNNVPIEGATVEGGRLVSVKATGHGLNPLLNAASAVAAGVALTIAPPLAAVALAGPLLTASPLLMQRFGDTNAPVHEMAHGMQFLLLGDLLNKGMVDASDFVAMQNDTGPTGYLWGGETEKAAHAAEKDGDIGPMFEVLRKRVAERLEERHSLAAGPLIEDAHRVLATHERWMTEALAARTA